MNVLFAEEFVVIDGLVCLLAGVISAAIAVYQLLNKSIPAEKKLSFLFTLAVGLALVTVGIYILITGKTLLR